ncbi:HAD family hydrolase [Maritalea mobilis]|uniref:HAD-IIB family hydrolase n=1 Tax=Maritalea mobilis TaxID=483324 RepID=UPI001C986435|nr:HAD-IIB family hydrolase [Maritalea mobilis]MBY6202175.1 HAD family hydrolase [Maritalea mobilis]
MTRHEQIDIPTIADKDLVLATDLDGTFLGGTDEERRSFYDWIEENRSRVGLIFVTGRDPGFITHLTRKQGVPRPDYVIGDVGTTIAAFDDSNHVSPIEELEAEIAEKWGDANRKVESALHRVSGLKLQSAAFRYRVSYDMDPNRFDPVAYDIVAEMGLDSLVSADCYFDVLPKDVSKGPSLLRLLEHLGIDNRKCLVAGDTMNDHSMLAMGVPAVAVGNSEAALIEALDGHDHVHLAKEHGVAGIAEAILRFEFLAAS